MTVVELLNKCGLVKPRVISYTRFSSRKQAKGLSEIRQVEAAKEWCDKHCLELSDHDQFKDLGVSAYSGANSTTGALAALQAKVAAGAIPRGTILIVEALDRLTRQSLPSAISLLMGLANSGLNVVTMTDPDKVWNSETMHDLGSFLMSVVTLYRGHQESAYKSDRLRKTFRKHRREGSQQAFGAAPGWLERESKVHPWTVVEERAEVVRKVFELAVAGLGSKAIAARANTEKWPIPTRLSKNDSIWHAQMPGQLLRNRSVLGEHQHRIRTHEANAQHWHGLAEGEPVKGYYPQIVSDELWAAARASVRGRFVHKRRDANFYNLWSGLMFCGHCGAPIHRKTEKKGYSKGQLQCSARLAGATKCPSMSAVNADFALLQAVYGHSHQDLADAQAVAKIDGIATLEAALADTEEQAQLAGDLVFKTGGKVPVFVNRSVRLAEEAEDLRRHIEELRALQLGDGGTGAFDEAWLETTMSFLYVADDVEALEARAALNLRLGRIVEAVWVYAYDCAFIKFRDEKLPLALPLPSKQLPSRANPQAKHHKPPPERVEKFKPIWAAHNDPAFELPEPKRPAARARKFSQLMVNLERVEEEDAEEVAAEL
ncbi:recombinase family protein [Pseudorhodoferax sp. Leaf265]|uniref:recombinase family protein n=1 Tax=Pseudorhodoferax sp. Leaf265 TaxID=1736315 RepID=UPI0006F87E48|nr:recombinase family protein [Pseudorhodoferax sp. Leaf265]KQP21393.1 hypothetical protein ASF45_04255 [Pseudorhodoferax sp. Leaf265]